MVGKLPRRKILMMEGLCLQKTAISCGNIGPCMLKTFSAVSFEKTWKKGKQKW